MYFVEDLFKQYGEQLGLEIVAGHGGMKRRIQVPEAQRPGLGLAGYLKNYAYRRIILFGRLEIDYLRHLDTQTRIKRLEALVNGQTPAVIVARRYRPPKEIIHLCEKQNLPLFRSNMSTMNLLSKLTLLLLENFAPTKTLHGTLVEVFGVGVLIQGDSSVGKSEAALGLIERGHRLISDDIVKVKKRENNNTIEGYGAELTRHHMEIRGIGIINVANLYGAVCVRDNKSIDLVVKIEVWDDQKFYDRVGCEDKFFDILSVNLPFHILPIKPGRDVVLLLETIALNHRLKGMGYNSATEFKSKLNAMIESKQNKRSHKVERIETYT